MQKQDESPGELLEGLQELHDRMQDLLSVLQGSEPKPEDVSVSWARCAESSELFELIGAMDPPTEAGERERFVHELESLARLNAVISLAIERQCDGMAEQLQRARKTIQGMGRQRTSDSGGSCNVIG